MFFRLTGQMQEFEIVDEVLDFQINVPVATTVQLRRPAPDEIESEEGRANARCSATCEVQTPPGFKKVVQGKTFNVAFEAFSVEPVNTQQELRKIRSQLATATLNVLNTIRWKVGELGPWHPLSNVAFSYSFDGQTWGEISPPMLGVRLIGKLPVYFGQDGQALIAAMIAAQDTEPISHDVLREAWTARIANPRSALILGIAALEVGTKWCLTRLLPDAAWLTRRSSPRVIEILNDFLPTYLAKREHLAAYAPPKEQVKRIEQAINARNTLIHHFPGIPRYDEAATQLEYLNLEETLWIVEDFLSLFDYYVGFDWAINHVRAETKQLLIDRNGGRALPTRAG